MANGVCESLSLGMGGVTFLLLRPDVLSEVCERGLSITDVLMKLFKLCLGIW